MKSAFVNRVIDTFMPLVSFINIYLLNVGSQIPFEKFAKLLSEVRYYLSVNLHQFEYDFEIALEFKK